MVEFITEKDITDSNTTLLKLNIIRMSQIIFVATRRHLFPSIATPLSMGGWR